MDSIVPIVADGTARDSYVICCSDVQFIAVLDYARAQTAAAAAFVVEMVISGIVSGDGRTAGYVHGCTTLDTDGMAVTHPYRCVGQVERSAGYIDVAGHGTVIIA